MVNSKKTQKLSPGDDKISELPDCIIHNIFSFLPIEDVLRTSALSKRWKSLPTSIFDIVFDETKYELRSDLKTSFFHSLETILLLHSAQCIRKFTLILKDKSIGLSRVNSWVSAAVSHKVQELDLSLPVSPVLPDDLFTSESLSRLKLNFSFKVPTFIQLPKLRTLHLRALGDLSAQLLEQLFSGCPALQELALHIDSWNNCKKITISIPTLRTLVICRKLSSLKPLEDYVIEIYAENLSSLKCINCGAIELLPCNLSSLNYAYIDEQISKQRAKEIMARNAIKLMRGIHHVKFLTLSNDILEYLSYEENFQFRLPVFLCLTHLKVIWGELDYTNHQVLKTILQQSPNLESLEIPQVLLPRYHSFLVDLPLCLTSCLKTVSISYFDLDVMDDRFIKCVLENARLLETITIICFEDYATDLEKQKEINHQLQAICTSAGCIIKFCENGSPPPEPDLF